MEFKNNILLSDFVDFDVYPWLEIKDIEKKIKGCNQKNIFIVFYISGNNKVKESLLEFLKKILKAVHLDFDNDIFILEADKTFKSSFKHLVQTLDFNQLLVFGLAPKQLGIHANLPLYQVRKLQECQVLFSEELGTIVNNRQKKGMLWQSLQKMFLTEKG